jgi:hypothetical protein
VTTDSQNGNLISICSKISSRILASDQVYHVGSGTSSSNWNRPSSRFLYATGSCRVCVQISLQNLSAPNLDLVDVAPVTSKIPEVTRKPVSVVTTLTLATSSANSPRALAVSELLSLLYAAYIADTRSPALSTSAVAARR